MPNKIRPGDVVRLKSGGPKMAAANLGENAAGDVAVSCEWFDEQHRAQTRTFSLAAIEKIALPQSGSAPWVMMTQQ